MERAPIPANEEERLVSLHALALLDTEPEERFDRITKTATQVFQVPISTLTLVDAKREWFKSCQGLPGREGDRAISFCGHALLASDVFVVPDTKKDKRFSDNPMVTGKPFIRFYAGVPLLSADGQRIGVFCIKDTEPREFSAEQQGLLKNLATWAELELNARNLSLALSEQKRLREVLVQRNRETELSRAKDEAILDSIGDGMIVVDEERKILFFSKSAEEMTGWAARDAIGKHAGEVVEMVDEKGTPIHPDKRPIHLALSTKKKVVSAAAYYFVLKNGARFPAAIVATPVTYGHAIIGAVLIFRDITKEKEVDEAKTEFVSVASHQLRTPLSAVSWYTEMLLAGDAGKLSELQEKYLRAVYEGNRRMVALLDALLNVSRLDLGSFIISPQPTAVPELVKGVLDDLMPFIVKKNITVHEHYAKDLAEFQADPKLLRMVLQNVISNSVKYSANNGAVTVNVIPVTRDHVFGGKRSATDNLAISVSDAGIGIPPAQQDKIFTKLFRADNAMETEAEGTGLGLYIVKSIIDRSGGQVWFRSEQGNGTTFYITLPLSGMRAKRGSKMLTQKNY